MHRETRIPVDVVLAGPGLEDAFLLRVEASITLSVPSRAIL